MAAKVWFITGTSRGFGREWAIAALERGDKVAATARDTASQYQKLRSQIVIPCGSGKGSGISTFSRTEPSRGFSR